MKTNKLIALIFILLMVSSVIVTFLSILSPQDEQTVKIPEERILNYELSEAQRRYLLPRGFTLIEYFYSSDCWECENQKTKLEQFTQDSEGQIFLQELISNEHKSTKLVVTNLKGQEILEDPSDEEIQGIICDMLFRTPLWCVTGKI